MRTRMKVVIGLLFASGVGAWFLLRPGQGPGMQSLGSQLVDNVRIKLGNPAEPRQLPDGTWLYRGIRMMYKPGPSYEASRVAQRLWDSGDREGAMALLDALILSDAPAYDVAVALGQKGSYLWLLQRLPEARDAYVEAIATFENDPDPHRPPGMEYGMWANKLSVLFSMERRWEEALAYNDRLLNVNGFFTEGQRQLVLVNRSKYLANLGRNEEAAASLDDLFERFPEYLNRDSLSVTLRLQRAELRDPRRRGEAYIAETQSIWNDPVIRPRFYSQQAGEAWARSLHNAGRNAEAVVVWREVLDHIQANLSEWTNPNRNPSEAVPSPEQLRRDMISICSTLSSAYAYGRPDLALDAIARLRQLEPGNDASFDIHEDVILRQMEREAARLQAR